MNTPQYSYRYYAIDAAGLRTGPLTACPECGADLTSLGGVEVELTDQGRTWVEKSKLAERGRLSDKTGDVRAGRHSQTSCAGCGGRLCDMDGVEEEQITAPEGAGFMPDTTLLHATHLVGDVVNLAGVGAVRLTHKAACRPRTRSARLGLAEYAYERLGAGILAEGEIGAVNSARAELERHVKTKFYAWLECQHCHDRFPIVFGRTDPYLDAHQAGWRSRGGLVSCPDCVTAFPDPETP